MRLTPEEQARIIEHNKNMNGKIFFGAHRSVGLFSQFKNDTKPTATTSTPTPKPAKIVLGGCTE